MERQKRLMNMEVGVDETKTLMVRWREAFNKMSTKKMSRSFDEYEEAARSTAEYKGVGGWRGVLYNTFKLTGEAGEISDKIGKIYGKSSLPSDEQIEDLKHELGDVLWHLSNLANDLGLCLEDVADSNIRKLKSRQERGVLMSGDGDNR